MILGVATGPGGGSRWLAALLAAAVSLSLLELGLRLVEPRPVYPSNAREDLFWQEDVELGWSHRPSAEGAFSDGYFRGEVHLDEHGLRRNAAEGTLVDSWPSVLFLGDSTTASLEVDDHETVPALLEQTLREQGRQLNVVNLGVRGYGTDQSVRAALRHAERLRVRRVVYLFTDNDVYDNQTLRAPLRRYGKSVVWRTDGSWTRRRAPTVESRDPAWWGAVVLDADSRPVLREGSFASLVDASSGPSGLRRHSALARRLASLVERYRPSSPIERLTRRYRAARVDPFEAPADEAIFALFWGTVDGGVARERHDDYYGAQMDYLLSSLRAIPSLVDVQVVAFPSEATLGLLQQGRTSLNRRLFEKLLGEGTIDGFLDLNQALLDEGRPLESLQCPRDPHFCEAGNRWVADRILESWRAIPIKRDRAANADGPPPADG